MQGLNKESFIFIYILFLVLPQCELNLITIMLEYVQYWNTIAFLKV